VKAKSSHEKHEKKAAGNTERQDPLSNNAADGTPEVSSFLCGFFRVLRGSLCFFTLSDAAREKSVGRGGQKGLC
jgi:hypothetical protein